MDEDGNVFTEAELPGYVEGTAPTVFVTCDPSWLLAVLDKAFAHREDWQYSFTLVQTEPVAGVESRRAKLRMFGLRTEGKRHRRMHQCWDPRHMSPTNIDTIIGEEITHVTLMTWARDLRAWAESQNLELRSAFAGYASQLLRDKRFYPDARRWVPRFTNEKARPYLPGNLMRLYVSAGPKGYDVTAIDQRQAHHRIAQDTPLPDGNTLFARGYFVEPENAPDYWAVRGSDVYERTMGQPGLVCVGMHSRHSLKGEYRLPVSEYNGFRKVWVWTNTVQFLEATGSHLEGIYAAWTSTAMDDGLSKYGEWAQSQIQTCTESRKKWLKPLLHSAYGLLAARPRPMKVGYRKLRNPSTWGQTKFLFGAREFPVFQVTAKKDWQPNIANVIMRGVIEAETQVRSLSMARTLTDAGCRVLHIHTDGMHVEGDLPLIPDSWSVSALTRVTYIDDVSWISEEKDCLPGRDAQLRADIVHHHTRMRLAYESNRFGPITRQFRRRRGPARDTQSPATGADVQAGGVRVHGRGGGDHENQGRGQPGNGPAESGAGDRPKENRLRG